MSEFMCESSIDYSTIQGETVLPFIISLDEEKSNLYPSEGEYQTFCYDILGTGRDSSRYKDLSHFLFGVCNRMTQSDIATITVVIDDEPQTINWGKNVEFKNSEKPDMPTGCVGLKFDFPLDKVSGEMEVCIALYKTYEVGPMNVCLFGGNYTATGLKICGPSCGVTPKDSCNHVFHQTETVSVPVEVTPYAVTGTTRVTCCGNPVIRTGAQSVITQCPLCKEACTFSISQNISIEIPISFGADVAIGDAIIQCGTVSESENDCGCNCGN